jgi:hypothetical protein
MRDKIDEDNIKMYFIATSGVCLFRSGTVGFQKKLQSQKKWLNSQIYESAYMY